MKKYIKPAIEIVEANLSADYLQPPIVGSYSEAEDLSLHGKDVPSASEYESDFDNEGW